jgi:hypothetical protein
MNVIDDDIAISTDTAGEDRWHRAFIAFVTVGIIVATVLGFREVINEPVIQLDDVRGSEEDVTPHEAQVMARNTSSDVTYCIEVTITATDRDGLSLASALAVPTTGDGTPTAKLAPGRTANFNATFDDADLTQQEIDEKLDTYYAFVTRQDAC